MREEKSKCNTNTKFQTSKSNALSPPFQPSVCLSVSARRTRVSPVVTCKMKSSRWCSKSRRGRTRKGVGGGSPATDHFKIFRRHA
jgi:hypothetical protein